MEFILFWISVQQIAALAHMMMEGRWQDVLHVAMIVSTFWMAFQFIVGGILLFALLISRAFKAKPPVQTEPVLAVQ